MSATRLHLRVAMIRPLALLLSIATPGLALANTHVASGGGGHASAPSAPAPAPTKAGEGGHRTPGNPAPPIIPHGPYPYRGPIVYGGGTGLVYLDPGYGYYREHTYATSAGPDRPLPGLALELGLGSRHMAASGEQLTSDTAIATQLRLLMSMRHGFYVGFEGEAGQVTGTQPQDGARTAEYGYAALLGVMERSHGVGIGFELAAGGRSYDTVPMEFTPTKSDTATVGVVEARVRGELALSPALSLGAMVGSSVIDHGDWTAGAYLSLHTRAFGWR